MGALTKIRELEARACAKASQSTPAATTAPRLPNWEEPYCAVPNAILRSALFAVIGKGQRASWMDGVAINSQSGIALTYTGEQLDQSDLDLWAAQLQLLRNHPLDQDHRSSMYALLQELGITDTGPSRASLKRRLQRLKNCKLSISADSSVYQGNLAEAQFLDSSLPLTLQLKHCKASTGLAIGLGPGDCTMG